MTGTDRKFGIAEILLLFSVLVLVIVVAVPILLILWNAFVVDGGLNIAGAVKVLSQPDVFQSGWPD
jgi:iron(III) transport system permease protein